MTLGQPVAPIAVQPPVPSILTTARDRTADGFGTPATPLSPAARDALDGAGVAIDVSSWSSGISFPTWCQRSYPWQDCNPDGNTKQLSDAGGTATFMPFSVFTPIECDQASQAAFMDQAAADLTRAHTAFGLARALWMGEGLPNAVAQPTLRNSADVIAGVYDLDDGAAQLLAAYSAGTGGNGGAVLHIPEVLMAGAEGGLPGGGRIARTEGQQFVGPLGSRISPGPGYPYGPSTQGVDGAGPMRVDGDGVPLDTPPQYAGNAADEVWVYVTGPVEYAAGPVKMIENRQGQVLRRNTAEVLAERRVIYRFNPCEVYATRVFNVTAAGGS